MRLCKLRIAVAGAMSVVLCAGFAFSGSDSVTTKLTPYGYGSFEFGQIMQGEYPWMQQNGPQDHYWMQRGLLQVGVKAERSDNWSIYLAGEGSMSWPYAQPSEGGPSGDQIYQALYQWYFHQAEIRYSLGESKANWPADPANHSPLQIDIGYFPFKYNSDSRDLGEYLFRLNSYPQYLVTDFDTPYTRLLGLRISSTLGGTLRQDVLLTSEVELLPVKDFSLAYLINYEAKCGARKFAEVGAGIMADRVFSVDQYITTPPASVYPYGFTFASTKLMVKASLDIKSFIPEIPQSIGLSWGENDCKLYSEMCVNGVDNYKLDSTLISEAGPLYPGYNDIKKRMPIMIGFDVPTFKLLDVLSVEAEWWDNDFANSYVGVLLNTYGIYPLPTRYNLLALTNPEAGPWHWSVYAERHIAKNVNIKFQVARDHTQFPVAINNNTYGDPYEIMGGHGDWAWMSKIEYGF